MKRGGGGNRNHDRMGRGQGPQGSPMPPPGNSVGYPQPPFHHHHHHQHQQPHHHHHHHHQNSYNNAYDGSRAPPQSMPSHGYGQGGQGDGWGGPHQQMMMYNQGYGGPMGQSGGYGDMPPGGYHQEMHSGQYPPSPSHMGGGQGGQMPYMRSQPMLSGMPGGPMPPGGYGGGPGPGSPMPMSYGRGQMPPMDSMPMNNAYGQGGMMRHDGYPEPRQSPPPQMGYGQNMNVAPPPPQQQQYGMGGGPPPRNMYGGEQRGKNNMNAGVSPNMNPARHPRVNSADPSSPPPQQQYGMGGGPPVRFNAPPIGPHGGMPPQGYMSMPPPPPPPQQQQQQMTMALPVMGLGEYQGEQLNLNESFYNFLKERNLLSYGNISSFFPPDYDPERDLPLKIAIDGAQYLVTLCNVLQRENPLWFLHTGLPFDLLKLVRRHVEGMRRLHLEPVWVFPGIGVSGDVETFVTTDRELRARDEVWSNLEEAIIPSQQSIEQAFDQTVGEEVQMAVARYLRTELNVAAYTSPFLNWAQMVANHKEKLVDLLMGAPEMLLLPYEPMKLIVEIDVLEDSTGAVAFFDRERVLRNLFPFHVTDTSTKDAGDRLMDLGLITATHPTLSPARVALKLKMQDVHAELSAEMAKYQSIKEFITCNSADDTKKKNGLTIKHSKGRGYLRFSPVFTTNPDGPPLVYLMRVLEPNLMISRVPNNISGVLGTPVPLSLYYLQFVGLLSVRIMTLITQAYLRDDCPVSDTQDYRDKMDTITSMRSQVISQVLRKIWPGRPEGRGEALSWVRWFDPILHPMHRPKDIIDLDEWELGNSDILNYFDENHLEVYRFSQLLTFSTAAGSSVRERENCTPRNMPIRYNGRKETFVAILLKVFDFLGYFTHASAGESVLDDGEGVTMMTDDGDAHVSQDENSNIGHENNDVSGGNQLNDHSVQKVFFPLFLMHAIECNPPSFQTAFVLLTEIIRVGIISSKPCVYIDPTPEEANSSDDPEENCDPRVLLASRIACLTTVPYERELDNLPFIWTPVYSRHLCAFTVMVRAMSRSLRELAEVITTTVFLTGNSNCSLSDFASFANILPFGEVPSTIGGLLLHYVLVFPADYQVNLNTPEERIDHLQRLFRDIPNIGDQLHMVMHFTLHALYLIRVYKLSDRDTVVPRDLLGDVTEETITLLLEKWKDHIAAEPPQDTLLQRWVQEGNKI